MHPGAAGPSEKGAQGLVWPTDDPSTPVRVRGTPSSLSLTPRKLDFGGAEADDTDCGSPMKWSPPSPVRRAASLSPDDMDIDDCFTPGRSPALSLLEAAMFAATDRSSIHYPGFDVFVEHGDVPAEPSTSSLTRKPSLGPGSAKKAKEQDKENVPPPRAKTPRVGKEEALAKVAGGALLRTGGAEIENWSPCAPEDGLGMSPKPRLNPHQLVKRGQAVPWLTPEHALSNHALKPLSTRLQEAASEEVEWEEDM
ncbi:hypothetical protein PsYK624_003210 [Phanerochaete sordida]|uniref:Uncharacterized protein n=1 Tax=Phanerochaete sordida TaxID=48140 RepID=A0A9P3FXN2_9APHY|nr:hypothetical protein PsYK624_003210 [Phanerochaete sordida]